MRAYAPERADTPLRCKPLATLCIHSGPGGGNLARMDDQSLVERKESRIGRPSSYTEAAGERVCQVIEAGVSLRALRRINRRQKGLYPPPATLYRWAEEHDAFRERFARAQRVQAGMYAGDVLDIVDEPLDMRLGGKVASAGVSRVSNRAAYRMKLAAQLDPDRFGERTKHEHSGQVGIGVVLLGSILPPRPLQPDIVLDAQGKVIEPPIEPKGASSP